MIRTKIENYKSKLKPEMYVNGKINAHLKNKGEAIVIPRSSVLWTGRRSVAYVKIDTKGQESLFEFREIEIGESMGEYFILHKGISIGEEVVTNGAFFIDASASAKQ